MDILKNLILFIFFRKNEEKNIVEAEKLFKKCLLIDPNYSEGKKALEMLYT